MRWPELPLLARYLLRELLVPLLLWVAFLFLLLFVMQFLRGTEVLLGSAVTPWDFLRLILHLSPHLLVMSLPVGFLLAILLGLGRLGEDRELLALLSLGATPWQLARVPLAVGGVLGVLVLLLASTAEPWGLKQVKVQVSEVIKKNVLGDVRPGVFYEDLTDLTLYAQEVDRERGVWTHVLVHDDRDPRAPLLVLAHEGTVNPSGRGASLAVGLQGGEVHRAEHTGTDYAVLSFRDGSLSIGVEDSILRKNHFRSPKEELTPRELLAAAEEARERRTEPGALPHRVPRPARRGADAAGLRAVRRAAGHVLARGADAGVHARPRRVRRLLHRGAELRELGHRRAARALARRRRSESHVRRLRDLALRPSHPAGGGGLMRGLLLRHVLRRYLVLVGAVLAGLLVVFLVADFVDRARAYTGPNWVRDVVELYGWKAVVATHQLAPAALLLASATLVSLLRRRG